MSNAPNILDTQSPYWLRLYGRWIHLNGIMPVNEVEPGRAFSELVTVDGYRYEQRAPRGPRTWELPYRYGTAAATAALESAAYDIVLNDAASGHTLFLDTNQAKVNMAPPDLLSTWRNPNVTSGPLVLNVGESEGQPIWLPTYDGGPNPAGGISIDVPVRAGVTYTATVWTTLGAAQTAITVTGAAAGAANGAAGATVASPAQATVVFTPVADGVVNVKPQLGFTAGLMVYEGNCAPTSYRAGRRMPCEVSVQDPKVTNNLIWRYCNPCNLPRENAVFTIREVGTYPATVVA